jgi:predicted PurR-regulated permease PerM
MRFQADMPVATRPPRPRSLYPLVILAAILYAIVQAAEVLAPILLSFLLILLAALALNPVVVRLRALGGGRRAATATVAIFFLGVLALTSWAVYQPVQRSAHQFLEQLPGYWERIEKPLQNLEQRLHRSRPPGSNTTSGNSGAEQKQFYLDGGQAFAGVSRGVKALVSNVTAVLIVCVTVFVGAIYTLLNPRPLFVAFFSFVPERHHEVSLRIARRIVDFIPRWALAMLSGMLVVGMMVLAAMWPLFGLQDALVLAIVAFVFEAIPYIGPILSGIPALLLATGPGGLTPLWVVIAYTGIQLLEHNIINPVIVAGQLQQHPLAVIFSVLFCFAVFGVLGVLLAAPLVSVVQILHEEIYRPRFLPNISDKGLDELARSTLSQNAAPSDVPGSEAAARGSKRSVHRSRRINE